MPLRVNLDGRRLLGATNAKSTAQDSSADDDRLSRGLPLASNRGLEGVVDSAGTFVGTLEGLTGSFSPASRILDFGCGDGDTVHGLCSLGYDAFGCDFDFRDGAHVDDLVSLGRLRRIERRPYSLPFDTGSFEIVISNQVFEHVMDYDHALEEIDRVLVDDGLSLHVFPARYGLIEPHVFVPGAAFFRARWWLALWARLGVRNAYQKGDSHALVVEKNWDYLRERTNYLNRRTIKDVFERHFPHVRFCEREYLRRNEPGGRLRKTMGGIPLVPRVYSAVRARVVYAGKVEAAPR